MINSAVVIFLVRVFFLLLLKTPFLKKTEFNGMQ